LSEYDQIENMKPTNQHGVVHKPLKYCKNRAKDTLILGDYISKYRKMYSFWTIGSTLALTKVKFGVKESTVDSFRPSCTFIGAMCYLWGEKPKIRPLSKPSCPAGNSAGKIPKKRIII